MKNNIDQYLEELKENDPTFFQEIIKTYEHKKSTLKHGGKRPNAGRKALPNKKITVSFALSPELIELIDIKRGDISRSKFLEATIKEIIE